MTKDTYPVRLYYHNDNITKWGNESGESGVSKTGLGMNPETV